MRSAPVLIIFQDGANALLPMSYTRRYKGLIRNYVSSPAGTYGGWISRDTLTDDHAALLLQYLLKRYRNLKWCFNPYDPTISQLKVVPTRQITTDIIYLDRFANEDALLNHYKHCVRKQIKKAQRAGLTVSPAENWSQWEQYYALYLKAIDRWGDSAGCCYSIDLFRYLFEVTGPSICLWLVKQDDSIVGGNINFYHQNHCVEWHAAFDSDSFKHGVRHLLIHTIIVDALQRGYRYYDFNPSGGHEGVMNFKQTWNPDRVAVPVIEKR